VAGEAENIFNILEKVEDACSAMSGGGMGGGGIGSSSSAVFFGAACLCIIHMSIEMQDKPHSRGKQGGSKAHHQHAIGIIRCPPSFRRVGEGQMRKNEQKRKDLLGDKINGLAESLGFDERCERRSDDWYALDNVQHRRGKVSKQIKDSKNFDLHAASNHSTCASANKRGPSPYVHAENKPAGASGMLTSTPRRARPRSTRKTPKRKMPEPRNRSRCAKKAYARSCPAISTTPPIVSKFPVPMSVLLKKNINPRALSSRPSASTANPYFRCLDTSFEFKRDLAISGFCASSDAEGM